MKVLHVIPSVSKVHGGPTLALAVIERSLSAIGVAVTTLTTDDDGPGRLLSDISPENEWAVRHYARKWSEFYKFSPGVLRWLLRHVRNFDVIHIHALFSFSSVAAALLARVNHVPYVVRPLGTLNTYGLNHRRPLLKSVSFKLVESRILAHAAAVHFTSQQELDEAEALGVPLRGVVIPLGVDGVQALESSRPAIKVRPEEQKVVLFLSRLDRKKNIEGLLRAFAAVRRQPTNARLVIAGDGPAEYVRALQNLAQTEGIAEATTWMGHLDGERKWDTLTAADVFVLPSFSENFGIAAVEALTAGLPCVVGSGVAIADAIAGAGAGLVTQSDASSIAQALDRLLGDEELRRKMGARGRELAEREYSSREMANRLLELYSSIARSARPSTRDSIAALDEQQRQAGRSK